MMARQLHFYHKKIWQNVIIITKFRENYNVGIHFGGTMNKEKLLKLIVLHLLGICILFGMSSESCAQNQIISMSVSAGGGYLPLKDFSDFYGKFSDTYNKDKAGKYLGFKFTHHLNQRHALVLHVEHISIAATSFVSMDRISEHGEILEEGWETFNTDFDFASTPIGLSYEFFINGMDKKISHILGVGLSFYISSLIYETIYIKNPLGLPDQKDTRDGRGYGFHAYYSMQYNFHQNYYFESRLRARYADGMYFTDKPGEIDIDFTGVDITLGLGWRF